MKTRQRRRWLNAVGIASAIMLSVALSACAVTESRLVESYIGGCSSALGSYTLPKTYLRAQVVRREKKVVLKPIEPVRRPDNDRFYCLDHVANAFADDDVKISKATVNKKIRRADKDETVTLPTQFLGTITSAAVDQSSIIIRKLIRAVAVGLSGDGSFLRASSDDDKTLLTVEFDPFDPGSMARANNDLRKFGFCLVLERFSFNTFRHGIRDYCNNPVWVASDLTPFAEIYLAQERKAEALPAKGIYYRPRAAYRLAIFTKTEPDLRGRWRLGKMENILLENISPVISVGIDRSAFTKRRMALVFDEGALHGVCLYKGSELLGALDIPLEIVRTIVALPAATMQAEYLRTVQATKLYQAEQEVITVQRQQIDFLNKKNDTIIQGMKNNKLKDPGQDVTVVDPFDDKKTFVALDAAPSFSTLLDAEYRSICDATSDPLTPPPAPPPTPIP